MLRALNETSSDGSSEDEDVPTFTKTKEAEEAEAFSLYNKALSYQRQGDGKKAEDTFQELLESQLLRETAAPEDEGTDRSVQPAGALLKYSTYKNLGSMAMTRQQYSAAMEHYLQAIVYDSTDVTLWYKIGLTATKIEHFTLARHAFEQGLECNRHHRLCMDNLVSILYALNDYYGCLAYIAQTLAKDPGYVKGICLMNQIFSEEPSLRMYMNDLFKMCDPEVFNIQVDKEDSDKFLKEALLIRQKKHERSTPSKLAVVKYERSLESFTWRRLGEWLIHCYDFIDQSRFLSLCCPLDLSTCCTKANIDQMETIAMEVEQHEAPIPVLPSAEDPVAMETALSTASVYPPTIGPSTSAIAQALGITPERDSVLVPSDSDDPQKRGQKRKRPLDGIRGERRSTRVRNTVTKKEEIKIDYKDIIRQLLPTRLISPIQQDDDEQSQDITMAVQSKHATNTSVVSRTTNETETALGNEEEGVKDFIEGSRKNCGIITIMRNYLTLLAKLSDTTWPEGLVLVYIKAYRKIRKNILFPEFLCQDETTNDFVRELSHICLVWSELYLDEWLSSKPRTSPGKSPAISAVIDSDFLGPQYLDDLYYMVSLTAQPDIMAELWSQFCIRVLWLKARYLVLQNEMEQAADCFNQVSSYLESYPKPYVKLVNCKMDNTINMEECDKQIDSLKRCQSLEEVQRLFENKEYSRVTDLLLQTFSQPRLKSSQVLDSNLPERHAQLLLLQESLLKLKDYKRCLLWSEVSLSESLANFISMKYGLAKDEWMTTISQLLNGLLLCIRQGGMIYGSLPAKNIIRFTQNLLDIIDMAIDMPDTTSDVPMATVAPWLLLYQLIKMEEDSMHSPRTGETPGEISSALMFLNVAHEFLGRRAWCTTNDGAFLLFFVDVLQDEIAGNEDHPNREQLEQCLEQCFYCMYGHPNKKTKAKHLQDHSAPQIPLTWERARAVFDYFKPKSVPEYDSYRTSTVSAELEFLLKRIAALVPCNMENYGNTIESVTAYIEERTNVMPALSSNTQDLYIVNELYYLLADYYFKNFKNKEQGKSIKFYIHDICYNPERFDSWAGMALARMSRLEWKLNSIDIKLEGSITKLAVSTLRCFKRAVSIDESNGKLWIEYGSIAYQLHSHFSRQLKQQKFLPLSQDVMENAKSYKEEMLMLAKSCYKRAAECDSEDHAEEEWLPHYMLGKVAEKMSQPPGTYLDHYKQAAHFLHEDHAKYPKKINYIVSPPHLAVEALEIFYRINASCMKFLQLHKDDEIDFDLIMKYVTEASEGPFAIGKEKKSERRELESSTADVESSVLITSQLSHNPRGDKTYTATPVDHDYPLHRPPGSSSADSSQESIIVSSDVNTILIDSTITITDSDVDNITDKQYDMETSNTKTTNKDITEVMTDILNEVEIINTSMDELLDTVEQVENDWSPGTAIRVEGSGSILKELDHNLTHALVHDSHDKSDVEKLEPNFTTDTDNLKDLRHDSNEAINVDQDKEARRLSSAVEISSTEFESTKASIHAVTMDLSPDKDSAFNDILTTKELVNSAETDQINNDIVKDNLPASTVHGGVRESLDNDKTTGEDELILDELTGLMLPKRTPETTKSTESEENNTAIHESTNQGETTDLSTGADMNKMEVDSNKDKTCIDRCEEFKVIMETCIDALKLCLSRFPQHYKAIYNLAHVYCWSPTLKDPQKAKDLLLGTTTPWQQLSHMPCQGLFHEKRVNNFFNNVWRIPIEEIDRSGSFPSHLFKIMRLLLQVLRDLNDGSTLLYMHQQLQKSPDSGKKYLRETERHYLAKQAITLAIEAYRENIAVRKDDREFCFDKNKVSKFLIEVYRVHQTGHKLSLFTEEVTSLLTEAYQTFKANQVESEPSILEQAQRYCQQQITLLKPQTPTHSEANKAVLSQSATTSKVPEQSKDKLSDVNQKESNNPKPTQLANILMHLDDDPNGASNIPTPSTLTAQVLDGLTPQQTHRLELQKDAPKIEFGKVLHGPIGSLLKDKSDFWSKSHSAFFSTADPRVVGTKPTSSGGTPKFVTKVTKPNSTTTPSFQPRQASFIAKNIIVTGTSSDSKPTPKVTQLSSQLTHSGDKARQISQLTHQPLPKFSIASAPDKMQLVKKPTSIHGSTTAKAISKVTLALSPTKVLNVKKAVTSIVANVSKSQTHHHHQRNHPLQTTGQTPKLSQQPHQVHLSQLTHQQTVASTLGMNMPLQSLLSTPRTMYETGHVTSNTRIPSPELIVLDSD